MRPVRQRFVRLLGHLYSVRSDSSVTSSACTRRSPGLTSPRHFASAKPSGDWHAEGLRVGIKARQKGGPNLTRNTTAAPSRLTQRSRPEAEAPKCRLTRNKPAPAVIG